MFDIGFLEFCVIATVALLVVGPERMPALVRSVGRWVGKMKRFMNEVKGDLERELKADELRQMMVDETASIDLGKVGAEVQDAVKETAKEANDSLEEGLFSLKNQELKPPRKVESTSAAE